MPYTAAEKPEAFKAWAESQNGNLLALFSDFKKESGDTTTHLLEFCRHMWRECDQSPWLP